MYPMCPIPLICVFSLTWQLTCGCECTAGVFWWRDRCVGDVTGVYRCRGRCVDRRRVELVGGVQMGGGWGAPQVTMPPPGCGLTRWGRNEGRARGTCLR